MSRWFCERSSCLCHSPRWTRALHHNACAGEREVPQKLIGCRIANDILSAIFAVGGDGSSGINVHTRQFADGSHRRLGL